MINGHSSYCGPFNEARLHPSATSPGGQSEPNYHWIVLRHIKLNLHSEERNKKIVTTDLGQQTNVLWDLTPGFLNYVVWKGASDHNYRHLRLRCKNDGILIGSPPCVDYLFSLPENRFGSISVCFSCSWFPHMLGWLGFEFLSSEIMSCGNAVMHFVTAPFGILGN